MSPIDLGPAPLVFPKPAIIRPADAELLRARKAGFQLLHLGGMAGGTPPVAFVADDGFSTQTSGGGTASHTHSSKTSTGPQTVLLVHAWDGSPRTLNSATFNGNALTIMYQVTTDISISSDVMFAFLFIVGAQSGNIVLTFDAATDDSYITIVSIKNLISTTPIDTDSHFERVSQGGNVLLDNLASPGAAGIRFGVGGGAGTPISPTGATVLTDTGGQAAVYDLGDDSGTITFPFDTGSSRGVAGVSLR